MCCRLREQARSHRVWWVHKCCVHPQSTVGASLLAIAVGQLMVMLDMMPSSRAGSLPQFFPSCS
nr:hypothetical protein C1892_12910 [Pseudomonas sp. MPBD7-1]